MSLAIVENLQAVVENMQGIVENLEERSARHLLGSPRRKPDIPRWPTYSQAAPAARELYRTDAPWIIFQRNVGPLEGHRAVPRPAAGS
jgi:hypothetical protein